MLGIVCCFVLIFLVTSFYDIKFYRREYLLTFIKEQTEHAQSPYATCEKSYSDINVETLNNQITLKTENNQNSPTKSFHRSPSKLSQLSPSKSIMKSPERSPTKQVISPSKSLKKQDTVVLEFNQTASRLDKYESELEERKKHLALTEKPKKNHEEPELELSFHLGDGESKAESDIVPKKKAYNLSIIKEELVDHTVMNETNMLRLKENKTEQNKEEDKVNENEKKKIVQDKDDISLNRKNYEDLKKNLNDNNENKVQKIDSNTNTNIKEVKEPKNSKESHDMSISSYHEGEMDFKIENPKDMKINIKPPKFDSSKVKFNNQVDTFRSENVETDRNTERPLVRECNNKNIKIFIFSQ